MPHTFVAPVVMPRPRKRGRRRIPKKAGTGATMPEPRDQDRELDALIDRLARLLNAEARYERGEAATRAELAALADEHLMPLACELRRLRLVLYPRLVGAETDA